MSKQQEHDLMNDRTAPRDAQKGGQGAVSKEHPERQLDQSGGPGPEPARRDPGSKKKSEK